RKFLDYGHGGHDIAPGTTVLFGNRQPRDPQLRQFGEDVAREFIVCIPTSCRFARHFLFDKPAQCLAQLFQLISVQFLHTLLPCSRMNTWYPFMNTESTVIYEYQFIFRDNPDS